MESLIDILQNVLVKLINIHELLRCDWLVNIDSRKQRFGNSMVEPDHICHVILSQSKGYVHHSEDYKCDCVDTSLNGLPLSFSCDLDVFHFLDLFLFLVSLALLRFFSFLVLLQLS